MEIVDLENLKEIQINILKCVAEFCEKNNIKYWLDSGTLLGAVRHKGYIPWDDDIDIGMLRSDYDKFLKLFNESNNKYKAYSIENNKDFLYPFCKVLDTDTILYEPDEKGLKLNINIDVFVYDNAPKDLSKLNKMYKKRDIYRGLNNIRTRQFTGYTKGIKRIIKWVMYPIVSLFPREYFVNKMINVAKTYINLHTGYVGNFTATEKIHCPDTWLNQSTYLEFEGCMFKAPLHYDEWLKAFYGNYMTLPPIEERVSHHYFKAYKI